MTSFPFHPPGAHPASRFGRAEKRPQRRGKPNLEAVRELHVVCARPIHHVMDYARLYRTLEDLRHRNRRLDVSVWLGSELRDWETFRDLPARRVARLPTTGERSEEMLGHFEHSSTYGVVFAPDGPGVTDEALETVVADLRQRLGDRFLGTCPWPEQERWYLKESAACARACSDFFTAVARESPRWVTAPDTPQRIRLNSAEPRVLIHQSRFHLGDTLWLTPLLSALRNLWPRARVTVAGPPRADEVLEGHPGVDELWTVGEDASRGLRAALVRQVATESFDAALFAFARRPESSWLKDAAAAAGVPVRVNLEYFDAAYDPLRPDDAVTHEAWCFWGAMPSSVMLAQLLGPFVDREAAEALLHRRPVEFAIPAAAHHRADEITSAIGFGSDPFVVLAPGALSSRSWPAERFAELARHLSELGVHVLVEGGPDDGGLLHRIEARSSVAPGNFARLVFRQDGLTELAALLARSRLLISNDSAPVHFAEAVRVPTLYFAQREKLVHSHPTGPACFALFDPEANDPARITVEQALGAIEEMRRRELIDF